MLFKLLLTLCITPNLRASPQSSLSRSKHSLVSYGNFKPDLYHFLSATVIKYFSVQTNIDCVFYCIEEESCYSVNTGTYPTAKNVYLCELLATDKYRATEKLQANVSFHHFSPWSGCDSGPCQNDANCVPDFELNSYRCDCKPGFAGIHCERRGKSCSEIKFYNSKAISASYVIDPDGEGGNGSFTVECDMTANNGVGVTVISHDSETRMQVTGFEVPGSYLRNVHYSGEGLHSLDQLAGLTVVSAHCEQFVMYECKNSLLFYPVGTPHGWWVSRDFDAMRYWGGATSADYYKCACGLNNTCADVYRACNCDKNDEVWRWDSGLLTEKSYLPVVQLKFGDTGDSSEEGYHTLGKLKCYGMA